MSKDDILFIFIYQRKKHFLTAYNSEIYVAARD